MKMLAEYFETATKFEQMAAHEIDPKLKAEFKKQAAAYRKLAEKRAKEYGLKMPMTVYLAAFDDFKSNPQ